MPCPQNRRGGVDDIVVDVFRARVGRGPAAVVRDTGAEHAIVGKFEVGRRDTELDRVVPNIVEYVVGEREIMLPTGGQNRVEHTTVLKTELRTVRWP